MHYTFTFPSAVLICALLSEHLANALWEAQLLHDGSFRQSTGSPRRVSHRDFTSSTRSRARRSRRPSVAGSRTPSIKHQINLTACTPGGKWPELKKFDLVISWWTNRNQSDIKRANGRPASFLEQGLQTHLDNQAEIKYALRSFEQYGLLEHVNNVYLLIGEKVLETYGAPRFFQYSNTGIHIINATDLGVPSSEDLGNIDQWSKLVLMHLIPGLSDYYIWLPDDNFLLKDFDISTFWDAAAHRPILRSYGSWSLGYCAGGRAVGATHGPVLLQKCAMQAVLDSHFGVGANGTKLIADHAYKKDPIDALCLFTRTMSPHWTDRGRDLKFHKECHTNGGCRYFRPCQSHHGCAPPDAFFINIQGYPVSDEYGADQTESKAQQAEDKARVVEFFHSHWSTPSRFELQQAPASH